MRRLLCLVLPMLLAVPAAADSGRVLDNLSMRTKILGGDRNFAVYLPPDYDTSERSYPILYLLHGAGDDHTGWVQFGEVLHIADKAIREGRATPMIIAMPDGFTGRIGFFNGPAGDWRYEDYFFEEFVPHVEKSFRVKSEKRYRAVAGLSMGGGGTLIYAMHRPDMFSSAAPLSAWVGPDTVENYRRMDESLVDIDDEVLERHRARHNAVDLAQALPVEDLSSVRWYIDCGDDDFLYEGNSRLHITLRQREVPHEYRIRDGGHSWPYWRESLPEVLHFVSEAFHQY